MVLVGNTHGDQVTVDQTSLLGLGAGVVVGGWSADRLETGGTAQKTLSPSKADHFLDANLPRVMMVNKA